jgi:hypothetical protein
LSLQATSQTYSITGNYTGFILGATLTAETGTLNLTGHNTDLNTSRKLQADPATFTFTGNSAGLNTSDIISAITGTFTLTGTNAALNLSRTLTAETGAFTFTGNNADLNTSSQAFTLIAETGIFGLTRNEIRDINEITIKPGIGTLGTKMSNRIELIKQGESLPFEFNLNGESTSGWICTIDVREYPKSTSLISRVIPTTTGYGWTGYLTSTETAALPEGTYRLTGIATNATNDEERQQPVRFTVSQPWG